MTIDQIAAVCHDANRTLCQNLGDHSQQPWLAAPQWQRDSAVAGVEFCIKNPTAPASANHDSWMKQKLDDGWVYGPVKSADAKTHPCIVSYDDLPPMQQAKDHLFKAIVGALAPFIK